MSEARMMEEWEEEQGFRITDDGGARWAVEQMKAADEEYERDLMWYQGLIEKARAKRDARKARMTEYLRDYAEIVPMKETKTQKSYPVPGGKLVLKKATTKLEHDDAVIMEDLKKQGRTEYIKTVVTEKLDWAGLKKDYLENGEAVDGITVVEVPETFTVQIDKEA